MQAGPGTPSIGFANFGEMLRYLRRRARLQQRDLAIAVGYSESQISRLEQNQRLPDMSTLAALFVPALGLETEPALAERLLELAAVARGEAPASSAPRARPPAAAAHIPTPLTPLIDRVRETEQLCAALARDDLRLLTLVGPPGIGKTRLALHAAASSGQLFADGMYFIALAPICDPALVLPTIAQALALGHTDDRPLLDMLSDALYNRRILLILDNFEQVLAAAPLVADLLKAAPQVKALVTSRAALQLSGEHLFAVPALALPAPQASATPAQLAEYAAVQLFVTRAEAVDTSFERSEENLRAIAAICANLDGLPLAIELAAARSRLFSPVSLLKRLHNASGARALHILIDGPRDLPSHQQTLRGTLDWSYALLHAEERALLARMVVFAGGCTAEAAAVVCSQPACGIDESAVLAGLQALVNQSLLNCDTSADGQPRFGMLETIREYAREQLDAGTFAETAKRHAGYYLELARAAMPALSGAEQERWFRQIETEFANLRAALAWFAGEDPAGGIELIVCLRQFWPMRGYLPEGRAQIEALMADTRSAAIPLPTRARGLATAGFLAYQQGDLPEARARSEAALGISQLLGDRRGMVDARLNLGSVAFYQNDYATAKALYAECLETYRGLGALPEAASVLKNIGLVAKDQGEFAQAIDCFTESLAIYRALGNQHGVAQALFNLAVVAYWQSDFARSSELSEQSVAAYRELGDRMGTAYALDTLGMAMSRQGDQQRARVLLDESMRLIREVGDRMGVALLLTDMGEAARARGDMAMARQLFGEGLVLSAQVGDKRRMAFCLEGLAQTLEATRGPKAARLLGAAEALREAIGAPLPPSERPSYMQAVEKVRQRCRNDAIFAGAWATGRSAALESVLADAIEHLPPMRSV